MKTKNIKTRSLDGIKLFDVHQNKDAFEMCHREGIKIAKLGNEKKYQEGKDRVCEEGREKRRPEVQELHCALFKNNRGRKDLL